MRLSGKVALITGSASGFGRASAVLFSREGAKVAVVDIDGKGAQQTVESIKQKGGEAFSIQADISRASDAEKMIKDTVNKYGRMDILFNNAGIALSSTPVDQVPEELFDRIMAVNVKGMFLGCKYVIPIMKKQGKGVIINTASISATRPRPGYSPYSISKGAVVLLTKALAIELAPFNIRVNCINPVAADTPMLGVILGEKDVAERKKAMLGTIPLGRFGVPEDVAYGALYLASDESSIVTGISLDVDGGRGI